MGDRRRRPCQLRPRSRAVEAQGWGFARAVRGVRGGVFVCVWCSVGGQVGALVQVDGGPGQGSRVRWGRVRCRLGTREVSTPRTGGDDAGGCFARVLLAIANARVLVPTFVTFNFSIRADLILPRQLEDDVDTGEGTQNSSLPSVRRTHPPTHLPRVPSRHSGYMSLRLGGAHTPAGAITGSSLNRGACPAADALC